MYRDINYNVKKLVSVFASFVGKWMLIASIIWDDRKKLNNHIRNQSVSTKDPLKLASSNLGFTVSDLFIIVKK